MSKRNYWEMILHWFFSFLQLVFVKALIGSGLSYKDDCIVSSLGKERYSWTRLSYLVASSPAWSSQLGMRHPYWVPQSRSSRSVTAFYSFQLLGSSSICPAFSSLSLIVWIHSLILSSIVSVMLLSRYFSFSFFSFQKFDLHVLLWLPLGLSCLGFTQFIQSVVLGLLPNLEIFQLLFLGVLFQPYPLSFLFLDGRKF